MKLYLSRRLNGLYQLTRFEPIVTNIIHTDKIDAYPQPGDPLVINGLCPIAVQMLFGRELELCHVTRVNIVCDELQSKTGDDHDIGNPGGKDVG